MVHLLSALICIAGALPRGVEKVSLPAGYEVVEIDSRDEIFGRPSVNNCGEIVYSSGYLSEVNYDVYRYDNGKITQLSHSPLRDIFPDINDNGLIVWMNGSQSGYSIVKFENGVITVIGEGESPRINSTGHAVWTNCPLETCLFGEEIHFYDGTNIQQITSNGLSNQLAVINDQDEIAWTVYGSDNPLILFYSEGETQLLSDFTTESVGPAINNLGVVAWIRHPGIDQWANGVRSILIESGSNPALNDVGDVYFIRQDPDVAAWQSWLYRDGTYYRLTDDNVWNTNGDMNNWGEVAWDWAANINDGGNIIPGGIRMLRRVRNGDVDNDGDIEPDDFAAMPACATGPVPQDRLCDCRFYDMAHDRTVDLRDFRLFQNTYANPQLPSGSCCLPHHGTGCNDEETEQCVCGTLPSCCSDHWSDDCVVLVEILGCGECP